jgi:hypothetical protein
LKIGAGRAILDIPISFFPYENFSGIHDPLHVRTLILDNGIKRVAIVVVELTSIKDVDEFRKIISEESNVDFENVFLCATHTFEAPHLSSNNQNLSKDEMKKGAIFKEVLNNAIISSVRQAKKNMQFGRIGFGTGQCDVNVNHDILTSKGWWKGSNFEGLSDKTVSVIRFETFEGNPIAFFINYPVQSSIMSESIPLDGKILISSDLGGATARYVEKQYDDKVVALWTMGAAGDQDPLFISNRYVIDKYGNYKRIDIHELGYVLIDLLGERLGYEVVRVSENIRDCKSVIVIKTMSKTVSCPGQEIFKNIHEMKPCKEYEYKKTKPIDVHFSIIILDNIALIGVQVELVCKTSLEIKQASPFKNTIIMTMVNGAAKYLPDAESYDKITYAAMNSMGAKGSAEILRDEIINVLDESVFA